MEEIFMRKAIYFARRALILDEVPVGAIIVKNNEIIASAHNLVETLRDPTAHAEILAIKKASQFIGNHRLVNCDMYVTLEPCSMCAGAIINSRIKNLYIGTFDPRAGACGTIVSIVQNESLNHFVNVNWMNNMECSEILKNFFKLKRC